MKKIIYLLFILFMVVSCSKETLYDIPRDANGNVLLTTTSTATTTGISTLDNGFSVTATLPNAKAGDVMKVECLQLQMPPEGGETMQLLPLAGSQKDITVGSDLTATVSYTRDEANLVNAGDYVVVVYNGKTDYAKQRIDLVPATTFSKPSVSGIEVDIARTSEIAYFHVNVEPVSGSYSGTLVAKMKNGVNEPWVDITGSPFSGNQPFLVPVSGDDFAADKDTMYYSFTAAAGPYTDVVTTSIVVRDPYFYKKRKATMLVGGNSSGLDLITNNLVPADSVVASLAIEGDSLILKGGSAWLATGKTIEFVPTTEEMYKNNNSNDAIAAFNAGTPSNSANPVIGEGYFIFKMVTGSNPEDAYYGIIKIEEVLPGSSISMEYRIGNLYAHLSVLE